MAASRDIGRFDEAVFIDACDRGFIRLVINQ